MWCTYEEGRGACDGASDGSFFFVLFIHFVNLPPCLMNHPPQCAYCYRWSAYTRRHRELAAFFLFLLAMMCTIVLHRFRTIVCSLVCLSSQMWLWHGNSFIHSYSQCRIKMPPALALRGKTRANFVTLHTCLLLRVTQLLLSHTAVQKDDDNDADDKTVTTLLII